MGGHAMAPHVGDKTNPALHWPLIKKSKMWKKIAKKLEKLLKEQLREHWG